MVLVGGCYNTHAEKNQICITVAETQGMQRFFVCYDITFYFLFDEPKYFYQFYLISDATAQSCQIQITWNFDFL